MTKPVPKHPSGRPIRQEVVRGRPIFQIPDDGFVTPRLRHRTLMPAIGFTVGRVHESDDEE